MTEEGEAIRQPVGERVASIQADLKNLAADVADMRPELRAVLLNVTQMSARLGPDFFDAHDKMRNTIGDHDKRLTVLERDVHGTENTDGLVTEVAGLKSAKQQGDGSKFVLWKIISGGSFLAAAAAAIKTWFDSGHH